MGVFAPARILNRVADGRLTTESGVAVSTSDRTSQSTLYYTPFVGNTIALYNGGWFYAEFSEVSLALSGLTSGKNYDVFGYDPTGTGTLALELSAAWTNDTTRADALTTISGVRVKSSDTTRRLLGTIRTTGTTTTADTKRLRFVWNENNRVQRMLYALNGDTYTYGTNTIRQMNSGATYQVELVSGKAEETALLAMTVLIETDQGDFATCGIGEDSTTAFSSSATPAVLRDFSTGNDGKRVSFSTSLAVIPGLGYRTYTMLERADSGTVQFIGDNRIVGHVAL